ncbi:MAG: hypothetical protein LBM66_01370 [Bifidobacteriaceae bacterium]|jgi:ABC-2 type transport system permease protein|nr:hypothetical protein [Bifidobacteriaceae bacterium]
MTALTGTARLALAWVRRDRLRLAVWLLVLPVINALFYTALNGMFGDDPAAMASRAALIKSATGVIFGGPEYGVDHYTVPAMMTNELLLYYEVPLAIGIILLALRATRAEEESGRYELVGAAVTGRYAPLAAMLSVTCLLSAGVALLMWASCLVCGLPVADSLAYGLAVGLTGMAFAGVAAVASQLTQTSRAGGGLAAAALGLAFVCRAAGDMRREHGSALSWLSPLAWGQQTRAYTDTRFWPLMLYAVPLVAGAAVAFLLARRRDLGAGLLPQRRGRARAGALLAGRRLVPLGLVWRLVRGNWLAWAVGAAVLGVAVGPLMGGQLGQFAESNPTAKKVLEPTGAATPTALANGFGAVMFLFLGLMALWFALTAVGRWRQAEDAGVAEQVLATPVARWRWLGAYAVAGAAGGVAIIVIGGFCLGVTEPAASRAGSALAQGLALAGDAFAYAPAVLATVGLAVALFGWLPRFGAVNWLVLAYSIVAGWFGGVLGLPAWAGRLAPLSATPRVPSVSVSWPALAWFLAAAAALAAAGLAGWRRRDLRAA